MAIKINNAAIQQINIGYNREEDRLLLKIGFSDEAELAAWLTRRLVKSLWQLLQAEDESPSALSDTARNQAGVSLSGDMRPTNLKKLDFTSEYKQRKTINMGETLLVKDCALLKAASQQDVLELACTNGQAIKLALTAEFSLAIINMLQLVSKETEWGLAMGLDMTTSDVMPISTALH